MEQYSSNLTDKQWQVIEKIINPQERKRKYSLRNIMNAILYLLKTGCQWRMIPKDFAPWESVYYYFSKWKNEGVIEELLDNIRSKIKAFRSQLRGIRDIPFFMFRLEKLWITRKNRWGDLGSPAKTGGERKNHNFVLW